MKSNARWLRAGLIVAIVLSGASAFGALEVFKKTVSRAQKDSFYEQVPIYTDALALIQAEYVKEVKSKDLVYGSLKGLLASLDAHSQFMDPQAYKEIQLETQGEFGGVGLVVTIRDDFLTVVTAVEGTPAARAGLQALDRIVEIDGSTTKDFVLQDAVNALRGRPGSVVTLMVLREGADKLLTLSITRDIIAIHSVKDPTLLEAGVGYVRIVEFQENTPADLDQAIQGLRAQKMKSLVLDLRNNPGGLLEVATEVAARFLPRGTLVVYTQGRHPQQRQDYLSHARESLLATPIVILVNGGTASAAEIVAGALQDHGRGLLVGEKTFGKGSVQTITPLRDGSALRLTTAYYYTPKGRQIHDLGIDPDVLIERTPAPKEAAKELPETPAAESEEEPQDRPAPPFKDVWRRDNQLLQAVNLLKGIQILEGHAQKPSS